MDEMKPAEKIRYYCELLECSESRLLVLSETLEALFQHEMADYIAEIATFIHDARVEIEQSILALELKKRGK